MATRPSHDAAAPPAWVHLTELASSKVCVCGGWVVCFGDLKVWMQRCTCHGSTKRNKPILLFPSSLFLSFFFPLSLSTHSKLDRRGLRMVSVGITNSMPYSACITVQEMQAMDRVPTCQNNVASHRVVILSLPHSAQCRIYTDVGLAILVGNVNSLLFLAATPA